ncbi:hypothetical protein [Actinomadura geliboluensis]
MTLVLLILIVMVAAAPTTSQQLAIQQRIIIELACLALAYVSHGMGRPPEAKE